MGLAVPSVSVQVMRLSPEADLGVNSSAIQIVDSVLSVVVISVLGLGHSDRGRVRRSHGGHVRPHLDGRGGRGLDRSPARRTHATGPHPAL